MMTKSTTAAPRYASLDGFLRRHRVLADVLFAVLLAIPLGVLSVGLIRASDSPLGLRLLMGLALLVLHGSVILRRLRPLLAFGAGGAAMLIFVLGPSLHQSPDISYPAVLLPSSLVFGVLLYSVAARSTYRISLGSLAVSLVGVVLVVVRLWDPAGWGGPSGSLAVLGWRLGLAAGLVAVAGCLFSLGRLSRMRELFLAELRAKAARGEKDRARERTEAAREERDRISREMHDVVSHSLAVMVSQAEGGRLSAPDSPSATVFATIAGVGRDALKDMRGLLGVLRGPDEGTQRLPQPGLADLPDVVARIRATGLRVELHEKGDPRLLRPAVDLAAYRVVQESLTNVVKHAGTSALADVIMTWQNDQLHIQVSDNGHAEPGAEPGVGLAGMRERLRVVGGTLHTDHTPGNGFTLTATLPYQTGTST